MHCLIAKTNPALMEQAIKHYLDQEKARRITPFTFESLYSDSEPYPLNELLITLAARINALNNQAKQEGLESLRVEVLPLTAKFKRLKALA